MADFFDRRDLKGVTSYADPRAQFEFLFDATEQLVHNDANNGTLELSWDGVNVHARLQSSGPSKAIVWSDHLRRRVWLRDATPSTSGARNVEVYAVTR